jgi:lysophospholipase L1-like esterase
MKHIILLALIFIAPYTVVSQAQPFSDEIEKFISLDKTIDVKQKNILFVGSSSFRLWDSLAVDFPSHHIINRGFGGSSLKDVYHYKEVLIDKFNPIQIVIYCGENDIAQGISAVQTVRRFETLFKYIRNQKSKAKITFVSIKPSIARQQYHSIIEEANSGIKNFLNKQKNTSYVDVYTAMYPAGTSLDETLFVNDKLHMTRKGYLIWKNLLAPHLLITQ